MYLGSITHRDCNIHALFYHFTYYKQIGITNHVLKFFHGTSYQAEMSDWIVYPQVLHKNTEVYNSIYAFC